MRGRRGTDSFFRHQDHLAAVQEELDYALEVHLCMEENELLTLRVGNIAAGHSFPSGAAHDRRARAELRAYEGENEVWTHGIVPEDVPLAAASSVSCLPFSNTA